ncbi:hypothetical protein EON64_13360 [archaeon]|nr:MAG: hypothetical protein EON64_13360 [archaeon]
MYSGPTHRYLDVMTVRPSQGARLVNVGASSLSPPITAGLLVEDISTLTSGARRLSNPSVALEQQQTSAARFGAIVCGAVYAIALCRDAAFLFTMNLNDTACCVLLLQAESARQPQGAGPAVMEGDGAGLLLRTLPFLLFSARPR